MSSYKHFTLEERKCLQEFLPQGYSLRKTAGFLGRNVSSVYHFPVIFSSGLTIERKRRGQER